MPTSREHYFHVQIRAIRLYRKALSRTEHRKVKEEEAAVCWNRKGLAKVFAEKSHG